MAGFVLVLPRFLVSGSLSTVLSAACNTRYDCSISEGKRAWKSIDVISVTARKVLALTVLI